MAIPERRRLRAEYRTTHAASETHTELPKKKFYRQRAHANPFSDHALVYPNSPASMDWSPHYPAYIEKSEATAPTAQDPPPRLTKQITVADVGCGFGGLLVALAPLMPDDLILGLEIRTQVASYVHDRILALRRQNQHQPPTPLPSSPSRTHYQNISITRANTMKFLPNFFPRGSLSHIFLCFPDPHFKARKHKARIVSDTLCAEYAYVLRPGGRVWTITDVEELAGWMGERFERFGDTSSSTNTPTDITTGIGDEGDTEIETRTKTTLFEKIPLPLENEEDAWSDKFTGMIVKCMRHETEEGKKVTRNGGNKFMSVWQRREDPPWPGE